MGPSSRAAVTAALLLFTFQVRAYVRGAGHLPQSKAKADATRLGDVIQRFQKERLGGKCVSLKTKHGIETLAYLLNEEGRGYFPPRAKTEAALYRSIKDAVAKGEKLDPEKVLELGLEANLRNGEVNLQETFLSIHNVIRLLARPETWWSDSHFSRGKLIWTPLGDVELTRGRWEPGWRGMGADSIYPIVKDITGYEPLGGTGPTLAEIRNSTWSQKGAEKQLEHQKNLEKARAAKQAGLDAEKAGLDKRMEERARMAGEIEQARQALAQPGQGGGIRAAAVRVGQMQDALSAYDRQTAELRATIRRLTLELAEDITTNATSNLYTRSMFDPENGVFSSLYGGEEEVGNGGNWYYFWLGATTWSAEGTAAVSFGSRYEAAQKWLGSEEEYARGLVQVSHFTGGAELARQAWARGKDCTPQGLVEREYWDSEKQVLRREYEYVLERGSKVRHGFERRYYRSGVLEYEATRKEDALDGVMTRYWENGAKFDVADYVANSRQGAYEAFYHEGEPRARGQFKGGRKVGPWITWHPKGFKESEGSYLPDFYLVESVPYENRGTDDVDKGLYHAMGAKTGHWMYWYAGAERKRLEETCDDEGKTRSPGGRLFGPRREWYDNAANSLKSEEDPSGASTTYHENGQLESRCTASGSCERYDRDGKRIE